MLVDQFKLMLKKPAYNSSYRSFWQCIHIDGPMLFLLAILSMVGLFILYSASNKSWHTIESRFIHLGLSFVIMVCFAQIPPISLQRSAIWVYVAGFILLLTVAFIGHIGKGGQRWLNFGFMHFQPSELMKLAIPLVLAWYYHKTHLPLNFRSSLIALPLIFVPTIITAKQPDLSTAALLTISGLSILFLAGISFRFLMACFAFFIACLPFAWYALHDYQRQRIFTFFDPEHDPLGKGYHIIQSKIAVGSGGLFGKGWLNGTQSNLHFLPEHSTDFIFAVVGEEFGFIGNILLITLYMLIVIRGLFITLNAQDTFSRLLAGSITFTFFVSFFINMGMVTGIVPVMGIPLPLISYGGSSMVTMMASFGILMSIQTHRKLVTT
jgi:rod shape determining protein RodA